MNAAELVRIFDNFSRSAQAIDIDGEAYWDGGYMGNPTITPLVRETDTQDTIVVQINPSNAGRRLEKRAKFSIVSTKSHSIPHS